jgi:hypothetical protein
LEESAGSFEMLTKTKWSYNRQYQVADSFQIMQIRFMKEIITIESSAAR